MIEVDIEDGARTEISEEMIRAQLELLVRDEVFRSSKRSVAFLTYVVEQTLKGSADSIKERTIGVEVFGRHPSYDTNQDHIVRTAASELRKRLAIYYGDEKHRSELRLGLVPGSYIPKFTLPAQPSLPAAEPEPEVVLASLEVEEPIIPPAAEEAVAAPVLPSRKSIYWLYAAGTVVAVLLCVSYLWLHRPTPQDLFWKPVVDGSAPVRIAVGDVPKGPPTLETDSPTPIVKPDSSKSVPFADAVTIAKVVGELETRGKQVIIRREGASSFSDLREGPVVLIGAFNNEWSLRLTRQLRYSLAMDDAQHLIYIRDAQNPGARTWSWGTNQPVGHPVGAHSPVQHDYALISRIRNSETGHVVVIIGGLYTYGTQAAGEFLSDPELLKQVSKMAKLNSDAQNLQIVLGTTVTDDTPGPPRILAVSVE